MTMFGKLWNNESKTITSAALLLGGASLASKFLGVIGPAVRQESSADPGRRDIGFIVPEDIDRGVLQS